jgi:hypothetical protein
MRSPKLLLNQLQVSQIVGAKTSKDLLGLPASRKTPEPPEEKTNCFFHYSEQENQRFHDCGKNLLAKDTLLFASMS